MQKVAFSWNIINIDALANLDWKWFIDYKTSEWQLIIFFLAYFLAGVVVTFIYSFFIQLKYTRTISSLNRTCTLHLDKISELESEVASLRSGSSLRESAPEIKEDVIDISSKETDSPEKKKLKKKEKSS
ncbi:Uncharacterized protein dnm_082660 [Desulfonema magnum]|uniref:LapA family protein n=2 Tax=Desulfonema magnum TaxID=45655 RepID=A0A975GSL9_9BACT|nr:Uncharacterized protein dnm_082660 [Desulfonema magnum]